MEKWEYCILAIEKKGAFRVQRVVLYLDSSSPTGFRKQIVDKKVDISKLPVIWDVDGPAIANLGNEGWELVHVREAPNWLYFKRRVPQH